MPFKLVIKAPMGPRRVDVGFGALEDAKAVTRWRVPAPPLESPDDEAARRTAASARDSVEFSRLAGKRWRYYARRQEAAASLDDLKERIASVPSAEVGFLLVVRAAWSARHPRLGVCWCRRTWCNHLVLDFAAVHPSALPGSGFGGVGTAMLQALALIAREIDSPLVWGEATELSAPFYQKVLGKELGEVQITDHFFIQEAVLQELRRQADAATKKT